MNARTCGTIGEETAAVCYTGDECWSDSCETMQRRRKRKDVKEEPPRRRKERLRKQIRGREEVTPIVDRRPIGKSSMQAAARVCVWCVLCARKAPKEMDHAQAILCSDISSLAESAAGTFSDEAVVFSRSAAERRREEEE